MCAARVSVHCAEVWGVARGMVIMRRLGDGVVGLGGTVSATISRGTLIILRRASPGSSRCSIDVCRKVTRRVPGRLLRERVCPVASIMKSTMKELRVRLGASFRTTSRLLLFARLPYVAVGRGTSGFMMYSRYYKYIPRLCTVGSRCTVS